MWIYFQVWLDLGTQTKLWGFFSLLSPLSCPSLPLIFLALIPACCGFAVGMTLSHLHTEYMDLALLSLSHSFLPGSDRKSDSVPPHPDIKNNGRAWLSSLLTSWPACPEKRENFPPLPNMHGDANFRSYLSEGYLCLCRACYRFFLSDAW